LPETGALLTSVAVGLEMSIEVEVADDGGFEVFFAPSGANGDPLAGYNGLADSLLAVACSVFTLALPSAGLPKPNPCVFCGLKSIN
jgi:hypothetical protein